jgi:hypothetical protein
MRPRSRTAVGSPPIGAGAAEAIRETLRRDSIPSTRPAGSDHHPEDRLARKALCVGISDYPGVPGDLPGAANDARAWARLLVGHYDFAPADVRLLLDERATRRELLAALDALLAGARSGDVLVLTCSAHGTYVPDRDGRSPSYDEALCPYDYRDNLIVEDELAERFAALASGVRLSFVSDAGHTGAASRFEPPGAVRRARFLAPEEWGGVSLPRLETVPPRRGVRPEPRRGALRLAACGPHQSAYDAGFGDAHHGAFTHFALRAIREQRFDLTWADLHARAGELLVDAGFAQDPRLEGDPALRKRRVFS